MFLKLYLLKVVLIIRFIVQAPPGSSKILCFIENIYNYNINSDLLWIWLNLRARRLGA